MINAMDKLKNKPDWLNGKALAKHIFETWQGVSLATGKGMLYTTCRAWRNNGVPSKHRAAICAAALARGWNVRIDDFRGDYDH
jgi:hypothetical protein